MNFLMDSNYGSDIDGNRGISQVVYDFEDTEEERKEIAQKLYDYFLCGEYQGSKIIEMWCPIICDDIEVEVEIEDYSTELITMALCDKDAMEDEEFKSYVLGKKKDISNCCGAEMIENTDLCSKCKEHAETKQWIRKI